MVKYHITPNELPSAGIMFCNHQKERRSGHLSHALVEYAPGQVLAFYSNCAGNRSGGHNGFGWIEYRRSTDGARTWGEPVKLEYAWDAFLNQPFTISCEKAVSPEENEIILFCTRCANPNGWEPYLTPTYLRSTDGGEIWKEMGELYLDRGRVYDAIVANGNIYVLELCNPSFYASVPQHKYHILESTDGGVSFHDRGILPGDLINHSYGSMELTPDGKLICYTYNSDDEFNMDVFISPDFGMTWTDKLKSYCAKRIRNPQVARVRGGYILHGRSGCKTDDLPKQFVLYTSENGIKWDNGVYIGWAKSPGDGGCSFYSNNLVLNEGDEQRVLIQASVGYYGGMTNVAHWYLDIDCKQPAEYKQDVSKI